MHAARVYLLAPSLIYVVADMLAVNRMGTENDVRKGKNANDVAETPHV